MNELKGTLAQARIALSSDTFYRGRSARAICQACFQLMRGRFAMHPKTRNHCNIVEMFDCLFRTATARSRNPTPAPPEPVETVNRRGTCPTVHRGDARKHKDAPSHMHQVTNPGNCGHTFPDQAKFSQNSRLRSTGPT